MTDKPYLLFVHWEADPILRTEWHPTEPTGPFKTLTRGAFATPEEAQKWADEHLGFSKTYSIERRDDDY
jgi:hypothetical protein